MTEILTGKTLLGKPLLRKPLLGKIFFFFSFLFPLLAQAQIQSAYAPNVPQVKSFSANLAQVAATYDLATASADLVINRITTFVSTAATGLTSITMQSNNTTSDVVLASTLLVNLTGGKNLTPINIPFLLPNTKKLQYTIVGTGSAGTLTVVVEYASPSGGTLN